MPKTLKRMKADRDVVLLQKILGSNGYFADQTPSHGIFDDITHHNVTLFQLQHIDKDGNQLAPDGVVGEKTWWALKNPSGVEQKNHYIPYIPNGLTNKRRQLLELLFEEHSKPVFEVPDGTNRSPDIDNYWGNTGLKGYAWCCAFVSWALYEILGKYPIPGGHHVGVQKMWRSAAKVDLDTKDPKPGDIFIQIKSGGMGHTGFVVGITENKKTIYTCEGNCGNRLKVGKRDVSTINHYIDSLNDGQGSDFEYSDYAVEDLVKKGTR